MKYYKPQLIIFALIIMSSILILFLVKCAMNDNDGENNTESNCDINCYKNYISININCFHEGFNCHQMGNSLFECNEEFFNCLEYANLETCDCVKNCKGCIKEVICPCLSDCEPYPTGGECKFDCWNKLCDCASWFDCTCLNNCGDKYKQCVSEIELPSTEEDYQLALQCVDALETCWLGCIAE